jgi:hypothetical protein
LRNRLAAGRYEIQDALATVVGYRKLSVAAGLGLRHLSR